MARLEGPIKFSGALGELVAYQWQGKWVVRRKSNLDKKRVKTDPAFRNTRKASQEFGGAATISKFLRDRWRPFMHKDKDPGVHNRLNKMLYEWIRNGQGTKGTRSFTWNAQSEDFQAVRLNRTDPPEHFLAKLPQYTRTGNTLDLVLNSTLTSSPEQATHVQVKILLLALPEFNWNGKKYAPLSALSPVILISSECVEIEAPISLAQSQNLSFTGCYALCIALTFYQKINGEYYPLKAQPLSWQYIVE